MRILGIDPGSSRIGYGLIERGKGKSLALLDYGVIEIKRKTVVEKMAGVGEYVEKLITSTKPEIAAVEKIYFSKNQKTAIEVAQARGIIIFLLLKHGIKVYEYGPSEIKMAVTGYGNSDKKGVAKMVKVILGIDSIEGHDDASDALAIAITAGGEFINSI